MLCKTKQAIKNNGSQDFNKELFLRICERYQVELSPINTKVQCKMRDGSIIEFGNEEVEEMITPPIKKKFRPCIVTFYNPETKKFDITERALFHCWGQSFEEFEDGTVGITVAIVELVNGQIHTTDPTLIKFEGDGDWY